MIRATWPAASADLGIEYPVALDNDYGVWDEFANHYWPALYLADAEGRIRFHHFGEGEYAMTEMAIQQLLAESGHDVDLELAAVDPRGLELGAEWATLRSPETYLGYGQSSGFASSGAEVYDGRHEYEPDGRLALNTWDLSGEWTMTREAVVLNAAGGRIRFAFHARDVNLILGPASSGTPVPFRVTLDDRAVGDARGADLDAEGARHRHAAGHSAADPSARGDRRPRRGGRVPRARGGGLLLHLRMTSAPECARHPVGGSERRDLGGTLGGGIRRHGERTPDIGRDEPGPRRIALRVEVGRGLLELRLVQAPVRTLRRDELARECPSRRCRRAP